jgi:hypothetical protein
MDEALTGRVSVYCVGAALDLQALRSHVFRRGFGNQRSDQLSNDEDDARKAELVLARGKPGEISIADDEVLHISNAPLFIAAAEKRATRRGDVVAENQVPMDGWETEVLDNFTPSTSVVGTSSTLVRDSGDREQDNDLSDEEWKQRELLLMTTQDIFYFDYGCVVFWGLSTAEEQAALAELGPFTVDPVSKGELESSYDTLEYVFDRKANPQRPIRFDRMKLRSLATAEKLALSYPMAQSSKLFVFESKVFDSVEMTRYLPKELAKKGRIDSSKKALTQLIGELFVEQTEVNLFSSILDTPDFLWENDEYQNTYQYTRAYLEVDNRVSLLNSRLAVIRDLLDVLAAQVPFVQSCLPPFYDPIAGNSFGHPGLSLSLRVCPFVPSTRSPTATPHVWNGSSSGSSPSKSSWASRPTRFSRANGWPPACSSPSPSSRTNVSIGRPFSARWIEHIISGLFSIFFLGVKRYNHRKTNSPSKDGGGKGGENVYIS